MGWQMNIGITTGGGGDGGIDADQFTAKVHECTTAIAGFTAASVTERFNFKVVIVFTEDADVSGLALIIPAVTVELRSEGLPPTAAPTAVTAWSELPLSQEGQARALILSKAGSVLGCARSPWHRSDCWLSSIAPFTEDASASHGGFGSDASIVRR